MSPERVEDFIQVRNMLSEIEAKAYKKNKLNKKK